MRRAGASCIGDVIALPFLYETRTILRLRRSAQIKPLSSSTFRHAEATSENTPPERTKKTSFLKAKAAASPSSSTSSRKTGTTITTAERRVFDDIFDQVAGKSSSNVASPPREKRDTFIDHEEILSIFSSAVSRHVAEQKAQAERNAATTHAGLYRRRALEDEEESLQRYPRPLRKAARRAAAAVIAAEEPGTLDGLASEVITYTAQKSDVPAESVPAESIQADHVQVNVQHTHLNNGQTHPAEKLEASSIDGSVTPKGGGLTDPQPWYLNLDGKKEDIPMERRPSFLGSGEDIEESDRSRGDIEESDGSRGDIEESDGSRGDIKESGGSRDLRFKPPGLRPSFLTVDKEGHHFQAGLRPSFLTIERREEDVASFAAHYGAIRPSFIRRAEDAAVVKERLQHDPESIFQGTIHRYCHERMGRIADSFRTAVTLQDDVGIWSTCLAKVFPMIELLDASLRNDKLSLGKMVKRSIRKTTCETSIPDAPKASITSFPAESPLPDLPPYVPPLYIISRLYPAALLLAFRLLRTKFPTSPFALALLPQIRTLGPTSYVLGASTEFYNALIELRWDVYSDLKSVDGLLMEMERNSVAFNVGTWNTLVKIGGDRFNDLHDADGGVRGLGFWERPTIVGWFQKVAVEWKMVVAARLREQGLGAEISEREYGTASLPEVGQANAEQGTVWL